MYFADYPYFCPNLTPRQIFKMGSFGGTYWRPIYSSITRKNYKNVHKKYKFLRNISKSLMTVPWNKYDKSINRYKVKVGTTLEYWELNGWVKKYHPYGWVHWYCDFYKGKRGPDDRRQIDRWMKIAGPNGRFRKRLLNMINEKKGKLNDYSISPKIRQTLQHWAYMIDK